MDEEMKNLFAEYNEHIEIFQTEHSELEQLRKDTPDYDALEQVTKDLEKEKD